MAIKKKKRTRKGSGNQEDAVVEYARRVAELQQELVEAKERAAEAMREREQGEARLVELEDLLEFTTERADTAEVFAIEQADSAGRAQLLAMQCSDLSENLARAQQDADSARRILNEYETLAEDAEERAYQAEHDLWLAEQRIHESQTSLQNGHHEGPLENVLAGLVERQVLTISLDLAVKQAARHRRKVALLSVGLIGSRDVKAMQPMLAKRLAKIVRDSDMLGRLDDETFGILIAEQTENEDIRFIAQCISRRADTVFAGPVVLDRRQHFMKVAIGVSIFPDDAPTGNLVLGHSESALTEARLVSQVGLTFFKERY